MAQISNLPIEYHQQDTDIYCGAACALMVLQNLGCGHPSENDLYNDNHSHSVIEGNWASGPDGLEWTMNQRSPSQQKFTLLEMNSEDAVSRAIAWSISSAGVASIALVYGYQHWITVTGCDASKLPLSPTDTSFTITGFTINNPWPPTPPGPQVPPHSTGDACGSGGDNGIANEHISYDAWQRDYMTGVPVGHWIGKFLAVCPRVSNAIGAGQIGKTKNQLTTTHSNSFQLIDKDLASKRAFESFNRLQTRGGGLMPLRLVDPKSKNEPFLVRRLDRENDYYYLVSLGQPGSGKIRSMVSIDGYTGNYRQSLDLADNFKEIQLQPLSIGSINEIVKKNLGFSDSGILKADLSIHIEDILVWKPCLESFSPYWPFHMTRVGGKTFYVRIDGEIFPDLTIGLAGS